MTLTIELVHAQLLFDVVIEAYRVRALAKSLTISKQYPSSDLYVLADSKRLQECLDNILSNAIKYHLDGRSTAQLKPMISTFAFSFATKEQDSRKNRDDSFVNSPALDRQQQVMREELV